VGATVRGLEYFGAVPEMLVPDQLRSAVKLPCRIEPEINETYAEMAQHYTTAVVPARPRKPKDKAKAEGSVLLAQRWILACLRNRRFFSLEELNAAIWELLEKLNTRPFQKLEGCRRSAFETLDRPAMRPLPVRRYEVGTWKLKVGVNIDYHFEYDHRFYSVPCELMNETVDVRATATAVEAWRDSRRVTSHERSYGPKGTAVTKDEHRPRSHREWGNWPPERLVSWAAQTGPKTAEVVAAILARQTHPVTGRRSCLGLMRMAERHGAARLEAACARAVAIGNPRYKSVEAILKTGLDKVALAEDAEPKTVVHENIRGGAYFDREETETAPSDDEIEARYLEEERLAIMNEPSVLASLPSPAVRGVTQPSPSRAATATLPALLERLRALWSRPPAAPMSRRHSTEEQGGEEPQPGPSGGASCASPSPCVEEEPKQHERMCDATRCETHEARDDSPGPRRGEVG
jgi:transposase